MNCRRLPLNVLFKLQILRVISSSNKKYFSFCAVLFPQGSCGQFQQLVQVDSPAVQWSSYLASHDFDGGAGTSTRHSDKSSQRHPLVATGNEVAQRGKDEQSRHCKISSTIFSNYAQTVSRFYNEISFSADEDFCSQTSFFFLIQ